MAPAKHPRTITTVCTECEWTGQRSLEKGDDLADQKCPRCGEAKLVELTDD